MDVFGEMDESVLGAKQARPNLDWPDTTLVGIAEESLGQRIIPGPGGVPYVIDWGRHLDEDVGIGMAEGWVLHHQVRLQRYVCLFESGMAVRAQVLARDPAGAEAEPFFAWMVVNHPDEVEEEIEEYCEHVCECYRSFVTQLQGLVDSAIESYNLREQ
jgi:hypothetical protein